MANYTPQVDKSHYGHSYQSRDRWLSYFYQLKQVKSQHPASVLEIGPGLGVVTDFLRKEGLHVTTCDIAPDLHPDVVGEVTALPFKDGEFDLVLAAEVLEHIRFEDAPRALKEIARVAGKSVVISLPHPGWLFSLAFKLPLLPHVGLFFQIPFFWATHQFNGEHYWELGKKGYQVSKFINEAKDAGLNLVSTHKYIDDSVHRFFVFKK